MFSSISLIAALPISPFEACFAKSIDRSTPVLLNLNKKGGSWIENNVSYEWVVQRVRPEIESGCPELWNYLKPQLEAGRRKGFFATSGSWKDVRSPSPTKSTL
jgi:hypothetical protein